MSAIPRFDQQINQVLQKTNFAMPLNIRNTLSKKLYRFSTRHIPRIKRKGYFSQEGQDKFIVERLFNNMRNGVFMDIGAHDGITFSNTYYLEKELGWSGIAVEPLPGVFDRLKVNRACIALNGCISDTPGEKKLLMLDGYAEMLSGVVDKFDQRHLARIEKALNRFGGNKQYISVPAYTFNDLVKQYGVRRIDYLSLDVEGGEYDILRSIDFDCVAIEVISVENNYWRGSFRRLLRKHSYKLVAIASGDEIYQKQC